MSQNKMMSAKSLKLEMSLGGSDSSTRITSLSLTTLIRGDSTWRFTSPTPLSLTSRWIRRWNHRLTTFSCHRKSWKDQRFLQWQGFIIRMPSCCTSLPLLCQEGRFRSCRPTSTKIQIYPRRLEYQLGTIARLEYQHQRSLETFHYPNRVMHQPWKVTP